MNVARTSKNLPVVALVAAAALIAALPLTAQDAPAADRAAKPKAVVAQPVHEAGTVATGEEVVHDFVIENQGQAALEITDVRPACGCTVAQFDRVIAPGASGKVHAVLDTSTFAGAIAKGVTVLTNDPAQPRLELTIKATIQPHLIVDPGFARFIQPQHSEPGVIEQRLWTQSFEDLQILEVISPFPHLEVTHKPIEADEDLHEMGVGRQHHLNLVFDYSRAPIGSVAEFVVIKTNHPTQPEAKVPVSGFVRPLVVLTPSVADFGSVTLSDDGAMGSILLKHYGSTPLEINSAEASVAGVEVEIEPVSAGTEFLVRVQLLPNMPKGAFNGTIRLSTNNPRKPTVEIPLSGTVG